MLKAYRELLVWQRAMEFAEEIYSLSQPFPSEEKYGLTSQLRRAVVSIPINIAEGYGKHHRKEYVHHLYIARGSLCETETLIALAVRLGFCDRERALPVWDRSSEVGVLLLRLIASLKPKR